MNDDRALHPRFMPSMALLVLLGCPGDDDGSPVASTTTTGTTTTGPDDTTTADSSTSGLADSTSGDSSSGTTGATDESGSSTGPGIIDPGCPECTVLAEGLMGGRGLNVHGDFVYFTDQEDGTVNRVPRAGGEVEELHELQAEPYDVIANDDYVFWTSFTKGGSVWRANLPDGPPIPLSSDEFPRMLQLGDGFVYWCAFDDIEGRVRRVSTEGIGNPPETLVSVGSGVADLVLDGDQVYFTAHDPPEGEGLAPPGAVYVAAADMPTDILDLTVLAPNQAEPWGLAVGGSTVFWVNGIGNPPRDPQSLQSLPSAGMVNPDTLINEQTAPWGVAADDTHVYWTDYTEVKALPHAGGDSILLGRMQLVARSIVEDGDDLFWITQERLLRRPKP